MVSLPNKHYLNEEKLKSAVKLFFKLNSIEPISGFPNEILCTLVAQETTKIQKVKGEI